MTSTGTPSSTTTAFTLQAALSFGIAVVAVGTGIAYLPVDAWVRAFLAIGTLFLISSTFTLAKCVRDVQEHAQRVEEARAPRAAAPVDLWAAG